MSSNRETTTTKTLQDALAFVFDLATEVREEVDGDDDDGTLADFARDLADTIGEVESAASYEEVGILSGGNGIVLRMADGAEFQISIVQSRLPRPA